jgi:hypothetical protein
VDVVLDKWDLKEGQDKYDFMEATVKDDSIEKVLMICDEEYMKKANQRKGGVGEETTIISPEVYTDAKQTKFIPVIFEKDKSGNAFLPIYLGSRKYIDLSNPDTEEEEYERLLRAIYNRPKNIKPKLGNPPTHIFIEESQSTTKTNSLANRIKYNLSRGKPFVIGLFEEYLDKLFSLLAEDFSIEEFDGIEPFDEDVIRKINEFLPYRNEFIDLLNEIIKYEHILSPFINLIHKFFEKLLKLLKIESNQIKWDQYRFIGWELFLHTTALFIARRRIGAFELLVSKYYLIPYEHDTKKYPYTAFQNTIRSLDNTRNKRLGTRRKSITVDELIKRVSKIVPPNFLIQADAILYMRSIKRFRPVWIPLTLINARNAYSQNLEFFIRAEESKELDLLLQFTDHDSLENLRQSISTIKLNENRYFGVFFSFSDIINFQKLGSST